MEILYVTGEFAKRERDTSIGGMAKAVYIIAKGMQKRGHAVRILTVDDKCRKWTYDGLEIISVAADNGLNCNKNVKCLFYIINREILIQREIGILNKERKIDLIQYTGWFGIGLLHYRRIPALMRVSSYTKIQLKDNYSDGRNALLTILEQLAAKRMNMIISPGNVIARSLGSDIQRKIYVMETPYIKYHGNLDFTLVDGALRGKKYLLFFGRMTKDKGVFVIRDIVFELLEKYRDLHFVFAGNSDAQGYIEKQIKEAAGIYSDRIIFLGNLEKSRLFPVIHNAYLILMPSLMDNFPNSCAEAMSEGKIVIGTDGSSLEQFIQNGYNGMLAAVGDANSLNDRIQDALRMGEQEYMQMSKNAQYRIQQLEPKKYFNKLEAAYRRVIEFTMGGI